MKIAGLITEYNPFHNGHKYHIEATRQLTGADYVVVIMSGNFVQRGAPAIADKYTRSEMALSCGADLILELPVCYAVSSAEFFALGAVKLLSSLGCIDYLCFGSESGNINTLYKIAEILINETDNYKRLLSSYLKQGLSYPLARANAISEHTGNTEYADILSSPNNILAIEYLKALKRTNSTIIPVTIKRLISDYHEKSLNSEITSATSIRNLVINNNRSIHDLDLYIPANAANILTKQYKKSFPIIENDFSQMIYYKLSQGNPATASEYLDSSKELSRRIYNKLNQYTYAEDFIKVLKTKDITYTRISRFLFHLILNLKKTSFNKYINDNIVYYARVLGFNKLSGPLLNNIKAASSIPLITKLADAKKFISETGIEMLEEDIYASHIYNRIIFDKYHTKISNEFTHQLVIKSF